MRFLYPTYDGRMLKDGQRPLYDNRIQPVSLKGRPELEKFPIPISVLSTLNLPMASVVFCVLQALDWN